MQRIATRGSGVIIYLRQEGRDIGLGNKIRAYHLQDEGADTVEANQALGFDADERRYDMCKPIFSFLGVSDIELMTNNPLKVEALQKLGISLCVFQLLPVKFAQSGLPGNETQQAWSYSQLGKHPLQEKPASWFLIHPQLAVESGNEIPDAISVDANIAAPYS